MKTKAEIRGAMREWRASLDGTWLDTASEALAKQLLMLDAYRSATRVCIFASLAGEVKLDTVLTDCRREGKRVYLPAYREVEKEYGFKEWVDGQPLRLGHWRVPEPDHDQFATLTGDVLVLVPGLAFDVQGGRIGYGAGYYDRLLQLSVEGGRRTTVGICFEAQVHALLPQEAWDLKMDFVVTERLTRNCRLLV